MNTEGTPETTMPPMPTSLPLSDVRENLRSIVDDVLATGNEFTVTRHGRPVAVLLSYDEYEAMIETLNILSDDDAMSAIAEAEAELGQVS